MILIMGMVEWRRKAGSGNGWVGLMVRGGDWIIGGLVVGGVRMGN